MHGLPLANYPRAGNLMALGINKDLEKTARQVIRSGGTVKITGSNHVLWDLPDGSRLRTGLTMSSRTAFHARRRIERALRCRR